MRQGQCDCKDCAGRYILIKDEEDPRLAMFDKPLKCFGCGIGWCSLLLGFVCPLIWYYAAILYLRKYYDKDPRERDGLAAAACAALACTVVTCTTVATIFLIRALREICLATPTLTRSKRVVTGCLVFSVPRSSFSHLLYVV